jgi:DNA-binding CsgD family transcriptional regulator/tetratricopeptide (TPR) repeat protein
MLAPAATVLWYAGKRGRVMLEWPLVGREPLLQRLAATMSEGAAPSVEIFGDAGVGKTRLAAELHRQQRTGRRHVAWVSASRPASAIPFAAFSELLTIPPGSVDQPGLMARLLDELRAGANDAGPIVLTIDDAHLLDTHSTALVHLAIGHRVASVVMTIRSGLTVPSVLTRLWKEGLAERIDLRPLDRAGAAGLAEAILGGAIDAVALGDLLRRSSGNPLYLRELVLGGVESGDLARDGAIWRSTGSPVPSSRLTELIKRRLGRLDDAQMSVVEALAIGGLVELRLLETAADVIGLERLEARGIVAVEQHGNRAIAMLAHPLYGEIVTTSMGRARARRQRRALSDGLERIGLRRRDDVLRLALWRLDGGGPVEGSLLLESAAVALGRFDARLAERLARAAMGSGGLAAALLVGRALAAQQRVAEADSVLRDAAGLAETDGDIAQVALARGDLLYFRSRRVHEAALVLGAALDRITDIDWRDELQAMLILFRAGAGELFEVADYGRRLLGRSGARSRAIVHTLVYSSIANVMLGRFSEAEQQVRIGLEHTASVADQLPLSGDLLRLNGGIANAYVGRAASAIALDEEGLRRAREARSTELVGMWLMVLAEAQLLAGEVDDALRTMQDGLAYARESDPFAVRGIDASLASICAAWLGRAELAASLRQEVIDQQLATDVRSRIWFDRATVWVTWLREGEREAARSAERSGRAAIADTHLVWGAWLLHDAVRLGEARSVVATLDELAGRVEGELVATMASHARAAAGDDAVALERVASRFQDIGSKLLAAEAAAQAQQAYLRQGRSRLARVAGARAALMAARCPGVLTPPLAGLSPVPLTSRERQIARLASAGLTSRDLGDRLGISVRTVDNHLGSIYSKLGVSGRGELATVLGVSSLLPDAEWNGSRRGD